MITYLQRFYALLVFAVLLLSVTVANSQWTKLDEPLPNNQTVSWGQYAFLEDKLYIFGGLMVPVGATSGNYSSDVWMLDTKTSGSQWQKVATMPTVRCGGYAATINGKIYILAGNTSSASTVVTTSTLEFDPSTNTFATKAPIPIGVVQCAGAVVGSKIFIMNGYAAGAVTRNVQMYDVETDKWTALANSPFASVYGAAAAVGSDIYLAAGYTGSVFLTTAYKGTWDGTTLTWKALPNYPQAAQRLGAGVINNKVYFCCGALPDALDKVYTFDVTANKWVASYSIPFATYNTSHIPGDGISMYFISGYKNPDIYKFSDSGTPVGILGINPTSLTFDIKTGDSKSRTVKISNGGLAPLSIDFTIPNDAPWLTCDQTSVTIPAVSSTTITISVDSKGMSDGANSSTLTLTTNDPNNKTATINVNMNLFTNIAKRRPLLEVFTSSTCGPCKPGNDNLHKVINPIDRDNYTVLKFQQDFPGTGDPYCTSESYARRGFYAINSIPRMECDGGWDQNASSFTDQTLSTYQDPLSFLNIKSSYTVSGTNVKVDVTLDPLENISSSNLVLHVAVAEKQTVKNKKSNGETIFYDVVKKMLPNQNGTAISALFRGKPVTKNFDFTFNGTYTLPSDGVAGKTVNLTTSNSVEDFANLEVVAWVQDIVTKQVLNSSWSSNTETSVADGSADPGFGITSCYPTPANSISTITYFVPKTEQVELALYNILGEKVAIIDNSLRQPGEHTVNFNASSLVNGFYSVWLKSESNQSGRMITVQH